jgi:ribose transport system ATP-binding protein
VSNLLRMTAISKRFPGVTALNSVALDVDRGEIVALVGENGAGKSTLMKILAGIYQPDSGTIHINGHQVFFRSPREAAGHGIGIIHQEIEVIDTLDIAANIFLGREPTWGGPVRLLNRKAMYSESEAVLARLGLHLSPRTLAGQLSTAHQQMVEVARAISLNARLLIMDEPTSSLTTAETDQLFRVVKSLKAEGVSIIYISHRLSEVETLADRVIVLRDGKNAGALQQGEINHSEMVRLMVGRELKDFYSLPAASRGDVSFEVKSLRTRRFPSCEVSLAVRRGEILGLAGLVGAGRSELAQAIFGADRPLAGTVLMEGKSLSIHSPQDAITNGIYLVPEDRRSLGLITEMTVRENITLPALYRYASAGMIHRPAETAASKTICEALKVKAPSVETAAAQLSGGNQQKVVLAKWLSLNPKVILFDEPTRGIDVGAKAEIYQLMRRLANDGVAIVMISSDMEEILGNSDRVAVMHEGRISGVLERSECTQEAIMRLAVA